MQSKRMIILAAIAVTTVFGDYVEVETEYGPIFGQSTDSGVAYFTSIPYAAPPVGSLRFRDPIDPPSWTDPLNTTVDPPGCMQVSNGGAFRPDVVSEDCHYLN